MAGNRTGTAKWKNARARTIRASIAQGIDQCPDCGTTLNYRENGYPNSVEVDHIIPHSLGGSDDAENLRVTCRWCNRSKGNRGARRRPVPRHVEPPTAIQW